MRFSEFQKKEVINLCTCEKLGNISDLIFDECKGKIESIVIAKESRWCSFFGEEEEYVIPFQCIKKVGADIILVEIHEKK